MVASHGRFISVFTFGHGERSVFVFEGLLEGALRWLKEEPGGPGGFLFERPHRDFLVLSGVPNEGPGRGPGAPVLKRDNRRFQAISSDLERSRTISGDLGRSRAI